MICLKPCLLKAFNLDLYTVYFTCINCLDKEEMFIYGINKTERVCVGDHAKGYWV